MSKFHASKETVNGVDFDSRMEADYYTSILLPRATRGEIRGLSIHPTYTLLPDFVYDGKSIKGLRYSADFSFIDNATNRENVIEIKGVEDKSFIMRKKIFLYQHRKIEYHELTYSRWSGWIEMSDYLELKRVRRKYAKLLLKPEENASDIALMNSRYGKLLDSVRPYEASREQAWKHRRYRRRATR